MVVTGKTGSFRNLDFKLLHWEVRFNTAAFLCGFQQTEMQKALLELNLSSMYFKIFVSN